MEALDKLSLRQLRYFAAVAEYGSFRQAAFKLNITQPTLSNQISVLEELLGLQLFERSRSGTSTTVEGRELLISARRVIEEAQGFSTQADPLPGGGIGTHSRYVTTTSGPYWLHILVRPLTTPY